MLLCVLMLGAGGFYTAINTVTIPSDDTEGIEVSPTKPEPAETAVAAPELVSPHNGATGVELTPRFLWKAVPEAKGYELVVSLNSGFSHTVISVSMGDTAYQSPPDLRYYQTQEYDTLTPSTRYYWMVAAKLTGGGWSPVWTFTTAPVPALIIKHNLNVNVNPPGSGSINPNSGTFDSGTQVTLIATPSSAWNFDHWSGADDNNVNPTTVTMTGPKNVTAYFVAKDTDGDGLTDEEERQIGTNPGYADTDHDGLNDYEEVKVKKTDPLNPDTDGDGVKDGNDLFPFYDAHIKVAIKHFEETSALGQGPDWFDLGDPYFKVWAGSLSEVSNKPVKGESTSLNNPYSVSFNIADNSQFVLIKIEVWDYDGGWSVDEQYDASSAPDSLAYQKQFNILGDTITETSNGAADGNLQGPQAKIIVEISTIPYQ